jgi:hypothetical protein
VANTDDNCPPLANAGQEDTDADELGNVCEPLYGTIDGNTDSDGDGCDDGIEARGVTFAPHAGGDRNPRDQYDFFDVDGDLDIDLGDVIAILNHFGLSPGHPDYDPLYDRYAPDPNRPWRTAAATGAEVGIDLKDAIIALQSFGHDCV